MPDPTKPRGRSPRASRKPRGTRSRSKSPINKNKGKLPHAQQQQQQQQQQRNYSGSSSNSHHDTNSNNKNSSQNSGRSGSSSSSSSSSKWQGMAGGFSAFITSIAGTAAAKATSGMGNSSDKSEHGQQGEFDLYLFAQSWAPSFCCTNTNKCKAETMQQLTEFSSHGLWPAYMSADKNKKTYPAFCTKSIDPVSGEKSKRKKHEWEKHGTCTRLSYLDYFAEESDLPNADTIQDANDLLQSAASLGGVVERNVLLDALGGPSMATLMVDNKCRLTEITTCWQKNADDTVGDQIECPDHLLGSGRNSAALCKCSSLFVDEAKSCTNITAEMIKMFKERKL